MTELNNVISEFLKSDFENMFGGRTTTQKKNKDDLQIVDLKQGFQLIEVKEDENPSKKISHLYKDGEKISDKHFTLPGLSSGFKDGYCELIHHFGKNNSKSKIVIVNTEGKIVLSQGDRLDYPYHLKGNIGKLGYYLYNLKSGEIIMLSDEEMIRGENYLIVGHEYSYSYHKPSFKTGIYKIDWYSCEVEIIDTYKK